MSTAKKLEALQAAYREDELEMILERLLRPKLEEFRQRLAEYEFDLQGFEAQYQVKSADLYEQFESGQRGDAAEHLEWLGVYDRYIELRDRIERIEQAL
jgi:hypothetical protein